MDQKITTLAALTQQYRPQIEAELTRILDHESTEQTLQQSLSYSLLAGGKRLRPLLTLATLLTFDETITEERLQASVAVEMIHTYSLIHDDLPAMDDSDYRRGKLASHKQFDEAQAILTGDGLLTDAFSVLATSGLPANQITELVDQLSLAAGSRGMVAGQVIDMEATGKQLSLAALQDLDRKKTGALFHYSVLAGVIMANATENQRQHLTDFAGKFGLAFQIYDDLVDEQAGTDEDEGKNSYAHLLGRKQAQQVLQETIAAGEAALDSVPHANLLQSFLTYFKG
ncbi:polyprenyl synthetase family protein [Fructilactobacillus carniphilus]|uniref:Polyprenyl synthetase family protein n=1 Tax=Fructilactobacillus carniphilus TaxID=2940297 RepID=A0ABY5BXB3_9LACO|nr:farnesyl diphosphate synthase [Fructilactobacillus carniphilus]USS91145.1 polyprenyl synthetase family protein [Fructilactobacillus carniphilus]